MKFELLAVLPAEAAPSAESSAGAMCTRRRLRAIPICAERIVLLALGWVAQHLIRLVDLLELLLRGLLVLRHVRMILPRQLPKRLPDVIRRGVARDPERLVIILELNWHTAPALQIADFHRLPIVPQLILNLEPENGRAVFGWLSS